ncbi:hypothetical protein D9758_001878 [Tetrapyrgos nigripes]|uniref:Bromo domain-containing protein n=1 Tax=Tetrapyrgos nigripes TaxID=182062 RepID=A0A8H5GTP0_9AGAR|nr:hypothetical protein D9758_001878 [Tetrapyrgos nigripes]
MNADEETFAVDDFEPSVDDAASKKRLGSGLTLVLPSLKSLKANKATKKTKSKSSAYSEHSFLEKKIPRPVKLKPLKEVLSKLLAQIKKKDDYAFFLHPVDVSQVSGYTDVVKHPMDFGTMTNKVNRGRYRSLEEFANDFRLVISNAKTFNPPGTIYYTEAERIDAWGSDHIAKAASTVIQYETDWNIEVDGDDNDPVNIEDDVEMSVPSPMDLDVPAPSAQSSAGPSRRSTRAPYKKPENANSSKLSESIDSEGRLPGSKDGLGAFPPGSDWAKTMLDLKLKGKKYKTKKERLRVEKEGPPLCADGSIDYYNMEDPFSILSTLVPDTLSRPKLTPLYPPSSQPLSQRQASYDPSASQTPQPPPSSSFPSPVNVSSSRPLFSPSSTNSKSRHWTVVRNASSRGKLKDREEDDPGDVPEWKLPREAHATDFGSLAFLAGELAEEMKRRSVSGDDEENCFNVIRDSLDCEVKAKQLQYKNQEGVVDPGTSYWNTARAAEAEDYLRDVVYGGVGGLAYARSIAEFVAPSQDSGSTSDLFLARWVQENVLDSLTDGRHSFLRETAFLLAQRARTGSSQLSGDAALQLRKSLELFPSVTQALQTLLQIRAHKIDMAALIRAPQELFQSEEVWAWKEIKAKQLADKPTGDGQPVSYEVESSDDLNHVLAYVANAISEYTQKSTMASVKEEDTETSSEDPILRKIRLNLLALTKRAPIDTIAGIPKELVPEHIRDRVPIA